MAWHPGQEVHEGEAECTSCSEVFGEDELTEGVCPECYGHEFMLCDECGEYFERHTSASEKHCQDCLDAPDFCCIVCGCHVEPDENEGDDANPLCSSCEVPEMD